MALKVYKSVNGVGYSFPVTVSQVKYRININPAYSTTVSGIQSAIEATAYFTSGRIVASGNYTTAEKTRTDDDVAIGLAIATSEINTAGTNYAVEDFITLSSTGKDAVIKVTTVNAGAVTDYEVVDPGTGFTTGVKSQSKTTSTAGAGFKLNVLTVTPATVYAESDPFKWTQFTAVTNYTEAKAVLMAEPYNVHHFKLKTPQAVMAQAKEHSVEFPNWVI